MPTYDDFPALSAAGTVLYPEDNWSQADVVTKFDDQTSVEVQRTSSTGLFDPLVVIVEDVESNADTIFAFLQARMRAVPFYFTHRKRGHILMRYWPEGNPPKIKYTRVVAGKPDRVRFELPLRQEGGA